MFLKVWRKKSFMRNLISLIKYIVAGCDVWNVYVLRSYQWGRIEYYNTQHYLPVSLCDHRDIPHAHAHKRIHTCRQRDRSIAWKPCAWRKQQNRTIIFPWLTQYFPLLPVHSIAISSKCNQTLVGIGHLSNILKYNTLLMYTAKYENFSKINQKIVN